MKKLKIYQKDFLTIYWTMRCWVAKIKVLIGGEAARK